VAADTPGHESDRADQENEPPGAKKYLTALGPGLISGASDDDPSGIATYAQAGATYQASALWTVPATLPLMMAVQEICDRTALATGKSLGALAREKFSGRLRLLIAILLIALIFANVVNLAADTLAVGKGMEMLGAGPAFLWNLIAGAGIAFILAKGSFATIERIFKWLCLALFAYVAVLFTVHADWGEILHGLLATRLHWDLSYWALIAAIFGTTISPYLFFWQSANRVEDLKAESSDGNAAGLNERGPQDTKTKKRLARVDVFTGMAFSVLIMFAIIVATAATLGQTGTEIGSADDAAKALEPIAGPFAKLLFALGFIGSGILAIPVLASSGAAGLSGLLNKNWDLDSSPRKAPVFYTLVLVGAVVGTVLSLIFSNPIQLLVLSATINAIAAAPFLIITMLIARDRKLMGDQVNGRLSNTLGWLTVVVMTILGILGIIGTIFGA